MYNLSKFTLFLLLISALFIACNRAPTSVFTVDVKQVKVGQEITFTDASEGANRYKWDFGDGITRNDLKKQIYAYSAPGTYNPILTTWNKKEKKTTTSTQAITVDNPAKQDIMGTGGATWYFYEAQDIVQWDSYTDKSTPINEMRTQETYYFQNKDTVIINDYGSHQLLRRWDITPANLVIWNPDTAASDYNVKTTYNIVKLYNGDMYLRLQLSGYYRLLYFKQ